MARHSPLATHGAQAKLTQFAKELRLVFPNAQRFNRGQHGVPAVVDACRAADATDLVVVHEHRVRFATLRRIPTSFFC